MSLTKGRVDACIALGANLGDARAAVQSAMQTISAWPQVQAAQPSSLYCSAPHEASGPDFVNAVLRIQTTFSAPALLECMQALEHAAGRERPYRNAPRTLDLDLIFYGDEIIATPELTVPHPRWQERAFVLLPLAEVCPEKVSPAMLQAVAHQAVEKCP